MKMTVVAGDDGSPSLVIVGVARGRSSCPLDGGRIRRQARWKRRGAATKAEDWLAVPAFQSVRIAVFQLTETAAGATSKGERE